MPNQFRLDPNPGELDYNGDKFDFERRLENYLFRLPQLCQCKFNSEVMVKLVGIFNRMLGCEGYVYDVEFDRIVLEGEEEFEFDGYFTRRSTFCGRLLEKGEAVYKCRDCGVDPHCALCSACFDATEHEGHDVGVMLHNDRDCCCGCGDPEVWKPEMVCPYHNASHNKTQQQLEEIIPPDIHAVIGVFVRVCLDLVICVLRYTPETLPKDLEASKVKFDAIRMAKGFSRCSTKHMHSAFNLLVWDDDAHTYAEFERLCQTALKCSLERARELRVGVDRVGRQVLLTSHNPESLVTATRVFTLTGFNCTIRSSFATFLEELTGFFIHYFTLLATSQALDSYYDGAYVTLVLDVLAKQLFAPHKDRSFPSQVNLGAPLGAPLGAHLPRTDQFSQDGSDTSHTSAQSTSFNPSHHNEDMADISQLTDSSRYMTEENSTYTDGATGEPGCEVREGTHNESGSDLIYLEEYQQYIGTPPDISLYTDFPFFSGTSAPIDTDIAPVILQPSPVQRVRFDWLLCYDDLYWRRLRMDLRRLYTATPLIGSKELRFNTAVHFAVNYPTYLSKPLIREPFVEQGMLAFSAQLLSVPSVAAHLVRNMNFLTYLMTLVERFFTAMPHEDKDALRLTRGFSSPVRYADVFSFRSSATAPQTTEYKSKPSVLIMQDLHLLLEHRSVQELIPLNHMHVAHFIYFLTFFQGMNPDCRKFDTHVEFETDTYITAFETSFFLYRMMRPFANSYHTSVASLAKAIRRCMYKIDFWIHRGGEAAAGQGGSYCVQFRSFYGINNELLEIVDFSVEGGGPVSFHYLLHWFLSLLLHHTSLLTPHCLFPLGFSDLRHLLMGCHLHHPSHSVNFKRMMAIFDFPLRAVVKSSQAKCNLWVRNGLTIRNQVINYRESTDSLFYLDLFMVQHMLVLFPPQIALFTLLDRFRLTNFLTLDLNHPSYDRNQLVDIGSDFFTILIYCLSERGKATNQTPEQELRREILHYTINPISFSELDRLLPDRLIDACSVSSVVREVCDFKPHETLNDIGTYVLKPEYFRLVNPYFYLISRNSRETAEKLKCKMGGSNYFVPWLQRIELGPFVHLGDFLHSPNVAILIFHTLYHSLFSEGTQTFLDDILQLYLIASEDENSSYSVKNIQTEGEQPGLWSHSTRMGFTYHASADSPAIQGTCLDMLLLAFRDDRFQTSKLKLVYVIGLFEKYGGSVANGLINTVKSALSDNAEAAAKAEADEKRRTEAKARRARIMKDFSQAQTEFMKNQEELYNETKFVDGELNEETMQELPHPSDVPYLSGNCLVCQEEGSDSARYGVLGFVQPSKLLSMLAFSELDLVSTVNLEGQGLVLTSHPKIYTEAHRIVHFDTNPSTPQNPPSSDGTQFGFHLSSCGHILHLSCVDEFYQQLESRQSNNPARNHVENINFREMVCPLCKSITNTILPITGNPGLGHPMINPPDNHGIPSVLDWRATLQGAFEVLVNVHNELDPQALLTNPTAVDSHVLHPYQLRKYGNAPALCPFSGDILAGLTEPLSMTGSALPFTALQSRRRAQVLTPSRTGNLIHEFMEQLSSTAFLPTGDPLKNDQLKDFFNLNKPGKLTGNHSHRITAGILDAYRKFLDIFRIVFAQRSLHSISVPAWREYGQNQNLLDPVLHSLAYTITFVEISDRSVQPSDSSSPDFIVDRVATITRDLLIILWGTLVSMAASAGAPYEASAIKRNLAHLTMLYGQPGSSIFLCDPFQLLVEFSVTVVPLVGLDVRQLIRHLLLVQVCKTIVGCIVSCNQESQSVVRGDLHEMPIGLADLIQFIGVKGLGAHLPVSALQVAWDQRGLKYAHHFIYQNGLVFTRKAILFLDACQVNLHRTFPKCDNELDELLSSIDLPSFTEIITEALQDETIRSTIVGWCSNCQDGFSSYQTGLVTEFPYPYRLIGLPPRIDKLFSACRRLRCSTCDAPPSNPGVCLSCGTVICVQTDCCRQGEDGEANIHRRYCTGHVGLFLVVHSGSVLLLHYRNGSYYLPPYLDAHGESDIELRRARPLYLDIKRYNTFLKDYLGHNIPQSICRRLEPNLDLGGWPTL